MPRLSWTTGSLSAAADGSFTHRQTLDISAALSEYYGRLVRQGQMFKIRSVDVRLKNPNTLAQDNNLSAAGSLLWIAPTAPRKKAWRNGLRAVQRLRRMAGVKSKDYDFRVGFHPDYGEVVGQAWVRSESNELTLCSSDPTDQNSCFSVWNAGNQPPTPVDPDLNGFGFPFDTPWALGTGDMDFKEGLGGDATYFTKDEASQQPDATHFQLMFAGAFDAAGLDDYAAGTNAEHIMGPFNVMCGVMGLQIDTTIPDDSETQTEDFEVLITLDVESWSPL